MLKYERAPNDFYPTPNWCTRTLINSGLLMARPWTIGAGGGILQRPVIWEPCAGDGRMMHTLRDAGFGLTGSDIAPLADDVRQLDFLGTDGLPMRKDKRWGFGSTVRECAPGATAIVTNPPYKSQQLIPIIDHALALLQPVGGLLCLLLRHQWEATKEGARLTTHPAFAGRLLMGRRVRWQEGSKDRDTKDHCWMIWDYSKPAHIPPLTLHATPEPLYSGRHMP